MTTFKIYKYPLELTGKIQSVMIEGASHILSIVKQIETPVMYVLVDVEQEKFTKTSIFDIRMIGSDHEIESHTDTPEDFRTYEFMNTLDFLDGALIYHFFVRRRFVE